MQQRIGLFVRIYLFWITFFIVSRFTFLLYHFVKTSALTFKDIGTIVFLGLRMDAAMAGYWTILSGLLLTVSVFFVGKYLRRTQALITFFLLLISILIVISDLELYKHWGFRMDNTPLMYAGEEGAASVPTFTWLKLISIFIALFPFFYLLFIRRISPRFDKLQKIRGRWALVMFLLTTALFIPIRSSFSVAPLNTGVVYFHKTNSFANHAGINVVWNFFRSLASANEFRYPSNFFPSEETDALLKQMTTTNDESIHLLKEPRPNVILIILESFTSRIIEPLGGEQGVTPNINHLAKEGLLFDRFYSSGDRTDKGIISILSGYPAQPKTSIIKFPNKTQSLPSLPKAMSQLGYHTSFVYGGDIGFANMESYLTMMGFSHITEDDDFDSDIDNSKWGVHDHFVFNRLLNECDSASNPFFKVMLSLSSHEPFDVPVEKPFRKGEDEASLFLNACHYTDSSLGVFIAQAKTKTWWKNTLVVITADHGHRFPDQNELKQKERFQIPLLLLGGALNKQDTIVHTVGSNTDLATTLLNQLGDHSSLFQFGKNLFATDVKPFALYIFNNGFGYIDSQNEFIYDFDMKDYIKQTGPAEEKKWAEAYLQALFSDYNKR
jgi:phosphoglycerol transferase MdoB-like AlkP superfamily enzyme